MIGAHVADALLADRWKSGDLWYALDLLFGYVAPAFIFLSGVTLRQALDRGSHEGAPAGDTVRRLARRYLTILLLGYWLQIPLLSLRQLIWSPSPAMLARLFNANILQTIAVAGLLLLLVVWIVGSVARAWPPLLLLALAGMIATPYLWRSDLYLGIPLPFRFYLAPQPPATFPLIPYGSYLLLGALLAGPLLALGADARNRWRMPLLGGLLAGAGLALDPLLHPHPPHDDFWRSSIQHILFRLGGTITGVSLCFALPERSLRPLAYVGRRSLAIYILHLMLIYGSPMTMGGRYWFGGLLDRALDPLGAILAVAVVLGLCCCTIILWDRLRRTHPGAALWGKRLWWGTFWGFFLLTP
jgi:hypothetical protein